MSTPPPAERLCATCRFWMRYGYDTYAPDTLASAQQKAGGICTSHKLLESYADGAYAEDTMTYPYNEGGMFWTGPQFGCVHWQAVAPSHQGFSTTIRNAPEDAMVVPETATTGTDSVLAVREVPADWWDAPCKNDT